MSLPQIWKPSQVLLSQQLLLGSCPELNNIRSCIFRLSEKKIWLNKNFPWRTELLYFINNLVLWLFSKWVDWHSKDPNFSTPHPVLLSCICHTICELPNVKKKFDFYPKLCTLNGETKVSYLEMTLNVKTFRILFLAFKGQCSNFLIYFKN